MRQNAPVWVVPGTEVVAISTFSLLSEAVARPTDFSSETPCCCTATPWIAGRLHFSARLVPTLAAADPPLHTIHRRAVFPELVARRIHTLEPDIRALSATAVEQTVRDDGFDFMALIGNLVPITVVAKPIGFRDADPVQLLDAAFDSTSLVGGTMSLDQLDALVSRTEIIHGLDSGPDRGRPSRRRAGDPAGGAVGGGCRHIGNG